MVVGYQQKNKRPINRRNDQKNNLTTSIPLSRYLITPQPIWHAIDITIQPGYTSYSNQAKVDPSVRLDVNSLLLRGMDLLKDEGKRFSSDKSRTGSDTSFMRTILKGGTLTDRVSALTLLVQSSPIHNLLALEQLFNMARKKNRRMVVLAMDAIKDLLTGGGLSSGTVREGLLPSDRKLKYMIDSVAGVDKLSDANLVVFAFEDRLKRLYYEFLGALEQISHDTLPHIRSRSMCVVFDLLVSKPEQEFNLLKLLVNKLGDQDRKVATKASFLVNQLLTDHHPQMSLILVKAVDEFMHRHLVSDRAHYYAIITLNQLVLSHDNADVALHLIDTYFGLFNKFANDARLKHAHIDHKLLSALLTGVNRAFPFAKDGLMTADIVAHQQSTKISVTTNPDQARVDLKTSSTLTSALSKHLETLFKIAHHDHFTVQVQALSLIFQIVQSKPDYISRYYRSLYASMLSVSSLASTKQLSMFLNLVYRSIKADTIADRAQAFLKRLVQLAAGDKRPGFAIGGLWMLAMLMQTKAVWNMVCMPEDQVVAFDPMARSPEYARAGTSCMWELVALANHFHPSVKVFARAMCAQKPLSMPVGVDPLQTFTLSKFLEKFTYKKPKKVAVDVHAKPVVGVARRTTFLPDSDLVPRKESMSEMTVGDGMPVNSSAFLKLSLNQVAADEVFFHQYFSKLDQLRRLKKPSLNVTPRTSDQVDVFEDVSDEDEIERAILNSAKSCEVLDDEPSKVDLDNDDEQDLMAMRAAMSSFDGDEGDVQDEVVDLELAFANSANMEDDSDDPGSATQQLNFDDVSDGYDSNDDNSRSRRKAKKSDKSKLGYSLSGSVFASAEEFSRMLESNEGLDEDALDGFEDSVPASLASTRTGQKKKKRKGVDVARGRPQKKTKKSLR